MKYFIQLTLLIFPLTSPASLLPLHLIHLPPGFKITKYASVPNAREMTLADDGIVFVGTRNNGKVFAVIPNENLSQAKKVITIASSLNMPNGVAYHQKNLYVATISKILRFDNISNHLYNPPSPIIINKQLPDKYHHGWKFIAFGPDGKLYVPIGAPCNACQSKDDRFGTITRMNADGSHFEIFSKGIRNSVGFDWEPQTKSLWFTDNGRDWLGDNLPPDELNHAPQKQMHFGFPYFYGDNKPDPKLGDKAPNRIYTPPVQLLAPHVAALGMRFYTGKMFPTIYQQHIFIAEHGSWNRSQKIGYRISLVKLKNGKPISYEPFATGWLQKQRVWGRPVDVLVMPDGALLVSDDYTGTIYRIYYAAKH